LSTRGWTVSEMWLGMSAAFAPLAKPKVRPHVIIHTAYRSPGVRQDPEKLRRWQRAGCFLPECTDRILGLGSVSQLSKASALQGSNRRNTCKKMGDVVNGPIDFLERKLAFIVLHGSLGQPNWEVARSISPRYAGQMVPSPSGLPFVAASL
jgi:hypothetical protein